MGTLGVAQGRRPRRLRAAYRGVRVGRPGVGGHGGDPDLVALVAEPYTGVEETHRRLRGLRDAFEERDDRRAVFLTVYARTTREVGARIRREAFEDPDWVADYLVSFANLYRRAVYDFETGNHGAVADPWQLAFEAAERGDALVVQDALLGINAHINYDLALALADVGIDPDREAKYADHLTVIEVLRGLVDETQDTLAERYAPGIETVDEAMGRIDERVSILTIGQCRDSAWRTAVALDSRLRTRRRLARWFMTVTATGVAHFVLASRHSETVHEALQTVEGADDGHA